MKLYTRDWLDNKELRRCSPLARAVLMDLMCLAAEGTPYGYVSDKMGPLDHRFIAGRCLVSANRLGAAIDELVTAGRVHMNTGSGYFIKRMVEDEDLRLRRANGGKEGGNPALMVGSKVNLPANHAVNGISRERAPAGSDSDSSEEFKLLAIEKPPERSRSEKALDLQLAWFNEAYAIYWRKIAPQNALKAYKKHIHTEQMRDAVLLAIREQTPMMMARERDARPYFASWLNAGRWDDEIETPQMAKTKEQKAMEMV